MRSPYTFIAPVLASLAAAGALAAATAEGHDAAPPVAQTLAPTGVANTSAVLHGRVDAGGQKTTYWFEIGPTTAYGASTQPDAVDKSFVMPAQSTVSGLVKGTTYHARLVARNDDGLSLGADVTFTTGTAIPTPVAPSPLPSEDSEPDDGSAPEPVLAP